MQPQVRPTIGKSDWFIHDRFGMFIHWGLYALGARHEWLMHNERIPVEEYERRYFRHFDPDLYDPELWATAAANAGMKYFVVTSKHHEGFCLWDSKFTDYKSTNTPCGRDLLTPMVNAFRSRGLRTGLYYSLIDWHHPHFVLDPHIGPYRDHPDREKLNRGRDQNKYADYLHAQVRELISLYRPDIMWFDFSYPKPDGSGKGRADWRSDELYRMVRELAPDILIDDRLDLPDAWDFKTPEQTQPRKWVEVNGTRVVWEACQTFSGSWGYHRDESDWRSVDELVRTLIDSVSKGGNLLLNVGPTGRGEFDQRALDRLDGIGQWMKRHSRSIYGCTEAPADQFICPQDCRLTYNPQTRRLYVHIFAWPYKHVHLDGLAGRVEYAQFLHDASEVKMNLDEWHAKQIDSQQATLTLNLPKQKPAVTVPVIELFLK
ncbi:MAG TPA: alpha-L-fucosidase [Tepidisphaeraceae bacterium]|nr:alpha-L-fucosidase [Tepidisphaeraceae bacterium]